MFNVRINIYLLTFFVFLLSQAFAGETATGRLTAHVDASFSKPDNRLHLNPAAGFGGGVTYLMGAKLAVGVETNITKTDRLLDVIGGTNQIEQVLATYSLTIRYTVLRFFDRLNIKAAGGVGVLQIKQPAHQVSLGALGEIEVPAESSASMMYRVGIEIEQVLSSLFAIRIAPEMQFANVEGMKRNIYMKGGVSVNIL